jgi:monoamine oxidase
VLTRVLFGPRGLRALSAGAAFESPRADLDSHSVADWFEALRLSGSTRHLADCLVGALFGGADLGDVSLLELVELLRHEGGAYGFMIGEVARAGHIAEGTSALCAHLRGRLTGRVHLAAAARAVELANDSVAVHVDNGEVIEADHAVMAVPTAALSRIDFVPTLPGRIRAANSAIRYGQATKVAVVVPPRKPFQAKAFIGGSTMSAGWRTRRVLYGFAPPGTEKCDATALTEDLCRGFGVEPHTVEHVEVVCWPHDQFTCGTYAHVSAGHFTDFRRSLPHRHGRVHFAGAERSNWTIYMEGAVESGELAARSVMAT